MKEGQYRSRWRYRIEKMRIYLLNASQSVIPNPDSFTSGYYFGIRYPLIFKNLDSSLNAHIFKAPHFFCYSMFKRDGQIETDIGEQCEVRSGVGVQPSPDGTFRLELKNNDEITMDFVALKVFISGTRIPFSRKKR